MSHAPEDFANTSLWSFHVDDDFYGMLDRWQTHFTQDWPLATSDIVHEASWVLAQEARRLDQRRLSDWLDLFTDDCLYWVPAAPGRQDPRANVCHAFDDRRRLEDRVYWLNTGLAYSQVPPSRTVHSVTNVEVLALDDATWLVRSVFTTHEFRTSSPRVFAGWNAHVLVAGESHRRIRMKQVNLLDADAGHENLTLIL